MNFHLSNEQNLALRNSLATAEDFDMLDALETFDDGDAREGYSALGDWDDADTAPNYGGELSSDGEWANGSTFARAREVFGLRI